MGESLVETPKVEYKMGESVTSVSCLQQSVSFGRFEHDSLCWERWSTFPTNKYLEEVEKCSTPGSVAKKKAYFEAHYKKIASRKAELLLDQEREGEAELVNPDDLATMGSVYNSNEEELDKIDRSENEVGSFDGEVSVEHLPVKSDCANVFNQENEVCSIDGEANVDHVPVKIDMAGVFNQENDASDLPSEMTEHYDVTLTLNDTSELGNLTRKECEDVDKFEDGDNCNREVSEVVNVEVTKDIGDLSEPRNFTSKECGDVDKFEDSIGDELPEEKVKNTISEEESKNIIKLASPKKIQKATLVKKTTSTANAKNIQASPIRKRTTAPMPKLPKLSTPKSSKPELSKFTKSANRLLDKKENRFTSLTSKKSVGPQSKGVVPTSLHMSLSLGPMNSDQASLTRKSLIMERMGDKDIVKRAFKAFQNTPQMSPTSLTKSSATNQSASTKAEPKGSLANTLPKKNEGIGRAAKTASTRTSQQGTGKTLLAPGLKKNGVAHQRNVKSVAASFSPRVQPQGNNQKEVSKKLELKLRTNALEATYMQSKSKVEKASQVKNPSRSINFTPKLPSSNNCGLGGSVHKEKGTSKTQVSG